MQGGPRPWQSQLDIQSIGGHPTSRSLSFTVRPFGEFGLVEFRSSIPLPSRPSANANASAIVRANNPHILMDIALFSYTIFMLIGGFRSKVERVERGGET